jgi:hypothetical protein
MDVFTSLVSRLEALERTYSGKSGSDISATSSASSASSNVTKDIDELKTHLIRLQTYVMETNTKLQDMVLAGNGTSLLSFGEVFSDSHPTPPTLMRNVTVGRDDDGHVSDSDGSVEENDNSAIETGV